MKLKKGFTLSEVLITMTLIGVISALVVPSLITGTGLKKKIVSLKKGYNTISGAYAQALANYSGDLDENVATLSTQLSNYMNAKYFYSVAEAPAIKTTATDGAAAGTSNWIVTEDDIAFKIVQKIDNAQCGGHSKIQINTKGSLDETKANKSCPCYIVTIDIDGLKKGESTKGNTEANASITRDSNNKITAITGDRFQVYISDTGVTAGNPAWGGTKGAAAIIMESDE